MHVDKNLHRLELRSFHELAHRTLKEYCKFCHKMHLIFSPDGSSCTDLAELLFCLFDGAKRKTIIYISSGGERQCLGLQHLTQPTFQGTHHV